jgi:hypothetical protein
LAIGPALPNVAASTKGKLTSSTPSNGEIGLGCGGTNSLIIDDFGNTVLVVSGVGGTDELWYDPHSNHFFFADGNNAGCTAPGPETCTAPGFLGIVDANGLPSASLIQEDSDFNRGGLPEPDNSAETDSGYPNTTTGSHSVAVYPGSCAAPQRSSQVYVPIRSLTVANTFPSPLPPGYNGLCGILSGSPGADTTGCIAVFTAPPACVRNTSQVSTPR